MDNKGTPNIRCLILLHSYGKNKRDFEVLDISYPIKLVEETKELEILHNNKNRTLEEENRLNYLIQILCEADSLIEMASMDIGQYGEVSEEIHKKLWNQNKEERIYCVNIDLWYSTTVDHFSQEIDTKIDYEYNLSDLETEWEYLDLLQKGSKIYYIDYEDSKSSYTIMGISEVCNNEFQESGIYYNVHSDKLPIETGYHAIYDQLVDSENSKFFSSEEKAKEAYEKYKVNKKNKR